MLLFDLIAESPYDPMELIEKYAQLDSRKKADAGSEYFILQQPISTYHDLVRDAGEKPSAEKADISVLHWMAELYLYAVQNEGLSWKEAVEQVPPAKLYLCYHPLHEASLSTGWRKMVHLDT